MKEQFYSIQEIADLLKVTYLTVYRWIQAGKLKSHRAERQYRIKRKDLNAFVKSYSRKKNN